MILGLYSVYDRVAGTYAEPFVAVNKQTAIRRFNYIMNNAKMIADDCELYYVGEFNTDTAVIVQKEVEFICNSEVAYE